MYGVALYLGVIVLLAPSAVVTFSIVGTRSPVTNRLSSAGLHDSDEWKRQEINFSILQHWKGGFVASALAVATTFSPLPAMAASPLLVDGQDAQGISMVTQSEVGKSIRGGIVRGAQFADKLDMSWERFSDSLRDEGKCDPRTNRRMFDNGFRRDGTRIGNPVLGALCTPEPLKNFDSAMASVVMGLGKEAAAEALSVDTATLGKKQEEIQQLIQPAFERAAKSVEEDIQRVPRQEFNRDLYAQMRAYGEFTQSRDTSRKMETTWGEKLLTKLAPGASREDYTSPFPKPDDTEFQPYDEGALLDALGAVSIALNKLQASGLIGHWEISIPEDDYWNVVTVAIDDDISIGGQILSRERNQPLSCSIGGALMRAAMDRAKIPYKMDTFFIDPTTTRQEDYNPTQLLVSLSDLGQ
eukprot:scaffold1522_cov166-Amphora_coffeaeformis.AAC.22